MSKQNLNEEQKTNKQPLPNKKEKKVITDVIEQNIISDNIEQPIINDTPNQEINENLLTENNITDQSNNDIPLISDEELQQLIESELSNNEEQPVKKSVYKAEADRPHDCGIHF